MVEFAIVGGVLLVVIFGCLEFGRATYTLASLNEGALRAARLAAVCPLNDPVIAPAVDFAGINGFDPTTNVNLQYLDANGAVLATPTVSSVYYVQVGVKNFSIPLFIPGMNISIVSQPFTATLPAESLGLSIGALGVAVSTAC